MAGADGSVPELVRAGHGAPCARRPGNSGGMPEGAGDRHIRAHQPASCRALKDDQQPRACGAASCDARQRHHGGTSERKARCTGGAPRSLQPVVVRLPTSEAAASSRGRGRIRSVAGIEDPTRRDRTAWRDTTCTGDCRGARGGPSRALFSIVAWIHLFLAGVQAQGYWKSAQPTSLLAGQGEIRLLGHGLLPGASDYVCSFRTNIVNQFRGEFEVRSSAMQVTSTTDASCPAPAWDLPGTTVMLEIYKADAPLRKEVSVHPCAC